MDPITQTENVADFRRVLSDIAWFSAVGRPETGVTCIQTWDEWCGPENECVESMHLAEQDVYDSFLPDASQTGPLAEVWDSVCEQVTDLAKKAVPYREDEDVWYGPVAAVCDAAWTAGLIALHIETERDIPGDLLVRWKWFCAGHWPCARDEAGTGVVIL